MPVNTELPDYSLPRSAIQKSRSDRREANLRSSVTAYQVSAADTKRCKFALDNKVREKETCFSLNKSFVCNHKVLKVQNKETERNEMKRKQAVDGFLDKSEHSFRS